MSRKKSIVKQFTSADETWTVPVTDTGYNKVSVFSRRTSGDGSAQVTVKGAFRSAADSNSKFQISAAAAGGADAIARLTNAADVPYPYLFVVWDATGTITGEVVVVFH